MKPQRDCPQPTACSLQPAVSAVGPPTASSLWSTACFYTDRLGSTRATETIEQYGGGWTTRNYYPFGEEIGSTANDQFKFASTYRDSATGLDYAVNRYYASGTARFLTPDPYQASGGPAVPQNWNRYAYVHNDPINYLDPVGLQEADPNPSGGGEWWFRLMPFYVPIPEGGTAVAGYYPMLTAPPGRAATPAGSTGGGARYDKSALVDGATALLDSKPCTDFLADVGQKALLNIAGKSSVNDLSPSEQVLYFMLGNPRELIPTHLRPATFSDMGQPRTDQYGNEVSAEAEYGDGNIQHIALYNAFFAKSVKEQNQTILHEAMHLVFRFGDADLARAANVYQGDASASSDFQKKLSEKCK
jgi:RHS repeat-associated protein